MKPKVTDYKLTTEDKAQIALGTMGLFRVEVRKLYYTKSKEHQNEWGICDTFTNRVAVDGKTAILDIDKIYPRDTEHHIQYCSTPLDNSEFFEKGSCTLYRRDIEVIPGWVESK